MSFRMDKTYNSEIFNTDLNKEFFSGKEASLKSFFESTRYFCNEEYFKDGYTFLDIGGSGGDFGAAIKAEVADIIPTVIDPSKACIETGKIKYPFTNFICGNFPEDLSEDQKFDVLSLQAFFPQIPEWKRFLIAMRKHALKYINISLTFRLDGSTVIDNDVSYFYYLDSGERAYQVIHNIYEFINFCSIHEMAVKKINFYGYHTDYIGHNFRCVPNSQQIKGNILLELFENPEDNPFRMGGAVDKGKYSKDYSFFVPEMDIIIDGKKFNPRSD